MHLSSAILKMEANMRLDESTMETGLVQSAVNTSSPLSNTSALEFPIQTRYDQLKSCGASIGPLNIASMMALNTGMAISFVHPYEQNGIPWGPAADEGHCENVLSMSSSVGCKSRNFVRNTFEK